MGRTDAGSSEQILRIAMAQIEVLDCLREDQIKTNVTSLLQWMDRAVLAYPDLDLILFPECCIQGAHPDAGPGVAVDVPGPHTEPLQAHCRAKRVWAHFNFIERGSGGVTFNTSVLFNPIGEVSLKYRKVNPFVPLEHNTPGDELPVCLGPKGSTLGIMLCYDGDFPETARELVHRGADIILRPAAYMEPYSAQWSFVNQARAWENRSYVIAVNRVGTSEQFTWFGKSMAVDYDGRVLVEAPAGVSWLTRVDVWPSHVRRIRAEHSVCNHLYNLRHRGHTAESPTGDGRNPYSLYRTWQ